MFWFLEDLPSAPLSAIDIASTNPSTCAIRSSACKDFHGMEKNKKNMLPYIVIFRAIILISKQKQMIKHITSAKDIGSFVTICQIQGKIKVKESHTRRKQPQLMTSSPASWPSLTSPTTRSACHRNQHQKDP